MLVLVLLGSILLSVLFVVALFFYDPVGAMPGVALFAAVWALVSWSSLRNS